MKRAARVQASIEILDEFLANYTPIDRLLKAWGHANRYAGSSDRRAIADIVYACLRNRYSLAWLAGGKDDGYSIACGYCLAQGWEVNAIFTGERHAPPKPSGVIPDRKLCDAPLDIPAWIPYIRPEDIKVLNEGRAPVDLRVNVKRVTVEMAQQALRDSGIHATPLANCPTALRVASGVKIKNTSLYQEGWIELQDASSQMAMAQVPSGSTVLDNCAGGGGKSLALAAQGRMVTSYDSNLARMADLPARAKRAGVSIEMVEKVPNRTFAVVLVDAPCSGSGTWRRTPAEKWRLTPQRFVELQSLQLEILQQAVQHVEPGGVLVYCTCSLFEAENMGVVEKFEKLCAVVHRERTTHWTPARDACDGFFQCIWRLE